MSWMPLLYETYENVMRGDIDDLVPQLLPIAHSTQNADVEVSINIDGEFEGSSAVLGKGKDKKTLIPVTEGSASRSGSCPVNHPLCDKLQYLAGDYTSFGGKKGGKFYANYMKQLNEWCTSEHSNEKAKAIYEYLKKGTLIADLVRTGTLLYDENNQLPEKLTESFVVFRVSGGYGNVTAVWQDKKLQADYIKYYSSTQADKSFCYVTGEVIPCSNNHPSKIRNTGDKAKLISANDSSGFTFRGRFIESTQAVNIGYEVSQKAHNALKWLIEKQGKRFGDKVFLLWGTNNENTPDFTADTADFTADAFDISDEGDDSLLLDTKFEIAQNFNKAIAGYKANLNTDTNLALIGLDSATTGRMSITFYREYRGAEACELISRIELWHKNCEWSHFYKFKEKKRVPFIGAPSPRDIAIITYGTEQNEIIKADDKLIAATVQRLLPCICDGTPIPRDIVSMAVKKAFRPQNYSNIYNWYKVLSITCSLVRKERFDENKEEWTMAIKETDDLNYNCGRLLAVADAIEGWALSDGLFDKKDEKRPTNAMRLFTRFSQYPCETWDLINKKLSFYKIKLGGKGRKLYDLLGEISSLIDPDELKKAKNLDGRMALGFDTQRKKIIDDAIASRNNKNNKNEENKED